MSIEDDARELLEADRAFWSLLKDFNRAHTRVLADAVEAADRRSKDLRAAFQRKHAPKRRVVVGLGMVSTCTPTGRNPRMIYSE